MLAEIKDLKLIKQQLGISNSDIYGDDSLLCVEGDSEEIALPIILQALGYEQLERSVRLYNLKGKDNVKNLEILLGYLKDWELEYL